MNADELNGNLKVAVDATKGQQAPGGAMARSLNRRKGSIPPQIDNGSADSS